MAGGKRLWHCGIFGKRMRVMKPMQGLLSAQKKPLSLLIMYTVWYIRNAVQKDCLIEYLLSGISTGCTWNWISSAITETYSVPWEKTVCQAKVSFNMILLPYPRVLHSFSYVYKKKKKELILLEMGLNSRRLKFRRTQMQRFVWL